MDDAKRLVREGETRVKETLRDVDGHDVSDDIGNAADKIRKDLGNMGDDLRDDADRAGDHVRRDVEEETRSL